MVNAARVSMHKEVKEFGKGDLKLITYLATHKHTSPFNHAFLSVRVKAPIFVARQLVKHKFMPWNEVSRRYVDEEPEYYMPVLRKRAENVKQGSSDEVVTSYAVDKEVALAMEESDDTYKYLLRNGVAPEVARAFLPQNMMTEWIWSGSLGAFADMLKLRLDPHTQKESRDVAQLILPIVQERFPVSIEALLEI